MQRLHIDDLTGMLLRSSDEWTLLELPAIAEEEQVIAIGEDEYHVRQVGDLLHAEREPRSTLDSLQAQLGSDTFAAQYQQRPVPPGGGMVKRSWVMRYEDLPPRSASRVIQSWDTASKEGSADRPGRRHHHHRRSAQAERCPLRQQASAGERLVQQYLVVPPR
jgi:hypothetical protein